MVLVRTTLYRAMVRVADLSCHDNCFAFSNGHYHCMIVPKPFDLDCKSKRQMDDLVWVHSPDQNSMVLVRTTSCRAMAIALQTCRAMTSALLWYAWPSGLDVNLIAGWMILRKIKINLIKWSLFGPLSLPCHGKKQQHRCAITIAAWKTDSRAMLAR